MDPNGSAGDEGTGWQQGRGGLARTGHAVGADASTEPIDHWTVETGVLAVAASPVTVTDERGTETYIGSSDGIHAIDDVGGERWMFETDGLIGATPAVESESNTRGATIYASCVDDTVYAIAADTGETRWETDIEGGHSAPAVVDGVVYVGSDDYSVYALDAATGEIVWQFETGGMVRSSPAVVDGVVYIGSGDGVVYAIDAETGERRWTADESAIGKIETVPAVANGTVFVGAGRAVHAFDGETGSHQWQFDPKPADTVSSPAVADGTVVCGCANTGLYGVDAETGDKQWVFAGDGGMGAPLVADGTAVVGDSDGSLYGVDVDSGGAVWSKAVGEGVSAGPALVDGVYYVGGERGTVATFRDESAETSATPYGTNDGVDAPSIGEQRTRTDWQCAGGDPSRSGHRDGAGPTAGVIPTWAFETGYRLHDELAVDGDSLYVGDENFSLLRSLSLADGAEQWTADTDGAVDSVPIVADGTVYVTASGGTLHAFDADTGDTAWTFETAGRLAAPTVGGDTVYVSAGNSFYALSAQAGTITWETELGGVGTGSPALAYGTLYFSCAETLFALDPATGSERWTIDIDSVTQPAIGDEQLFVGGADELRAIDAETGTERWQAAIDGRPETPAVRDGVVYVGTDAGTVLAFDAADGAQQWTATARDGVSAPAVDGETVYVSAGDENLYAIDAATGEERYFFEVDGKTGRPIVADDTICLVAGAHTVRVLGPHDPGEPTPIVDPTHWGCRGGDLGATGHAGGGGPIGDIETRWEGDLGKRAAGSAIVENGVVYAPTGSKTVSAYDISMGDRLWDADIGKTSEGAPVIADDRLYVGTNGGRLVALDAATGAEQWTFEATASGFSHISVSPAVGEKTVFAPSTDGHLYAVDTETGDQRWRFGAGEDLEAAPIVAGDIVYVGGDDVYAIDIDTGTKLWSNSPTTGAVTGLAVADGMVIAGTSGGVVHAIDCDRGTTRWTDRTDRTVSPPAVADGVVYVGSSGQLLAIDAETGVRQWCYEFDEAVSPPAVADGVVYVGTTGGTLAAIDGGEPSWSVDLGERARVVSSPAIADGCVSIVDTEGRLVTVSESGHDPDGPPAQVRTRAAEATGEQSEAGETDEPAESAAAESRYLDSAADETPDPTDDQLQEAILGTLCDEWKQSDRNVRLSLEAITNRVATVLPGATEGLVRHTVQRLDESAYIDFERGFETVSLRARGAGRYQELSGNWVIPDEQLRSVLEPLYERSRQQPQAPRMGRDELIERSSLSADAIDRTVWFLKDVGVAIGDIYLDAGGYIDVYAASGTEGWWQSATINRFGKQLYEHLS